MEKLTEINSETDYPYFNQQFLRPDGDYLVSSEFESGSNSSVDLYTFARQRGWFSEYDIGTITLRLFHILSMFHEKELYLTLLTPQNIRVKESRGRNNPTIEI